jgi:hypothetical protein
MKRAIWTGVLVAALHGAALAQGPIPDPWVQNNYVVVPAPGGGAYALGYNSRQWSYWQTQTDPRGNMYGYDTYGNYWTYNRRANTYQYFRTEPRWQARCYASVAELC